MVWRGSTVPSFQRSRAPAATACARESKLATAGAQTEPRGLAARPPVRSRLMPTCAGQRLARVMYRMPAMGSRMLVHRMYLWLRDWSVVRAPAFATQQRAVPVVHRRAPRTASSPLVRNAAQAPVGVMGRKRVRGPRPHVHLMSLHL